MSGSTIEARLNLDGFENVPKVALKRPVMRKAFRKSGGIVAKAARKKISSRKGREDYPAKRTGRLAKSIKVKAWRSGLFAKVYHEKRADQKDFYATFLAYGTSEGLKARDNWIVDALEENAAAVRDELTRGMLEALA